MSTSTEIDTFALSAETMGRDLLAALVGELRTMPDHWARLNEASQQQQIDRLKEKIGATVESALQMLACGSFAVVPAVLESVGWKKGISATLNVARDALHRHALCDAQGQRVLVVMVDVMQWVQRMDEVKARADQPDLFDRNYHPSVDQPGYRRDQDRITPAGRTWQDLKDNLLASSQQATEEPAADSAASDAPEPTVSFDVASADDVDRRGRRRALHADLFMIGCMIDLVVVLGFTEQEVAATQAWLAAYSADPLECKVARPLWIPPLNGPLPP